MPTVANSTISNLTPGNCYLFTWTVTDGTCVASDEVEICVDIMPTVFAGADQQICANTAILGATDPIPYSGVWSFTGGTGYPDPTILFNENMTTTAVAGLKAGQTYQFTWTVENGTCTATDDVVITVDSEPVSVDAGPDQQLCDVSTATLTANSSSGTGQWTSMDAGITFIDDIDPSTDVQGMMASNCYTLLWTVTDGTCQASDEVEICIDILPTASAGADQVFCGNIAVLNANDPAPYSGQWTLVSGQAGVIFNSSFYNTGVLNIPSRRNL